jgi:hypothetical protein
VVSQVRCQAVHIRRKKESRVKVRNLIGTALKSCACGTWIAHWTGHKGTSQSECANLACKNPHTLGGHVKQAGPGAPADQMIVPLCDSCNKLIGEFSVMDNWPAPAGTCP